jgi:hypothetical protein
MGGVRGWCVAHSVGVIIPALKTTDRITDDGPSNRHPLSRVGSWADRPRSWHRTVKSRRLRPKAAIPALRCSSILTAKGRHWRSCAVSRR